MADVFAEILADDVRELVDFDVVSPVLFQRDVLDVRVPENRRRVSGERLRCV